MTLTEDEGKENSAYPVQFTDHYGPKSVRGPESLVQTKKVKNRTPEFQMFGYGGGGIGLNKEKVVQTRGRWDFSGYITSTKGSVWYNTLRWKLKENSLEWQPTHNNLFHTAFALQHNAKRFYMTVHVSGKLAKRSDRIKSRLKFGEKGRKDEEIVTKIEWAKGYSCPSQLDREAQYLHEAMGMANMNKVPVEIPGALAASYHPVIANQVPPTMPTPLPLPGPQHAQQHPSLRPLLGSESSANVGGEVSTAGNSIHHLLAELSMAAAGFTRRLPQPPRPPPLETSRPAATEAEDNSENSEGSSSSVTLVNSAVATQAEQESPDKPEPDTWQDESAEEEKDEEEKKEIGPRNQGNGGWLGVTAVLLYWLGRMGVLFLGLAAIVGRPPKAKGKRNRKGSNLKPKFLEADGASMSSRAKIPAARSPYSPRGRLRGRYRQRTHLSVDVGTQKRRGWKEDVQLSA